MNDLQSREKIRELFERIGYELGDDIFNALFDTAQQPGSGGMCSVNAFRDVLNRFILDNNLKK